MKLNSFKFMAVGCSKRNAESKNNMSEIKKEQYVIFSKSRSLYFVAIHGFTPMFAPMDTKTESKAKAKRFPSKKAATDYAITELFDDVSGFRIEKV